MGITVWHSSFGMEQLAGKDALGVLLDGLSHFGERAYWLSAGTLLGFERDGGFIPYDTDIDIAVMGEEEITLPESYRRIRFIESDGKPMQRAYIHEPSNIIFDIFHYYEDGDHIFNRQEKGQITRSKHLVQPLAKKTYLEQEFSVPNNIDEYLTEWYGDWRTPVRGGKTEWVK